MVRRVRAAVVLLVLAAAMTALAASSQADFAAATGFSGRNGFTCAACHAPPPELVPEATITVDGVPPEWEPGATYGLTVRVEGGPPALPPPAPQGGFELDTDGGTFTVPAGMEEALRMPRPHLVTYTPAGTLMREWQVEWNAPDLSFQPGTVQIWAAGVAANGNHNAQLNLSTGGEHGDRTATEIYVVPASSTALQAWLDLPLAPPSVSAPDATVGRGEDLVLTGRHMDANATHLAWRLDGQEWSREETTRSWQIVLKDLPSGAHVLDVRSEGADRVSEAVQVHVDVRGGLFDRGVPAVPVPLVAASLLMGAAVRRAWNRDPGHCLA